MTPRILCELLTDTQARAIQIRDAVSGDLVGRNVRRSSLDIQGPDELANWICFGDVGFNIEGDAAAWKDQVAARWTSGPLANRILAGSRIHQHRCPHPDGEESYVTLEEGTTILKFKYYASGQGDGVAHAFVSPIKLTANTAITVTTSAAVTVFVAVNGFTGP